MRPEKRQAGAPPHWNLYVNVANVDETVKKAEGLGARVFARPFDVMDAGRMAVLQDPTGAVFQVWQAKQHTGAKILNEPGTLVWSELTTRDTKSAESFYTALFGWTAKHSPPGAPMEYTEFDNQGKPGVGMMAMPKQVPAPVPSYWMPCFQVADCDASTAKAKQLGSNAMVGPQDIPGTGRFAILADPQGAMFAVHVGETVACRKRWLALLREGASHLSVGAQNPGARFTVLSLSRRKRWLALSPERCQPPFMVELEALNVHFWYRHTQLCSDPKKILNQQALVNISI